MVPTVETIRKRSFIHILQHRNNQHLPVSSVYYIYNFQIENVLFFFC